MVPFLFFQRQLIIIFNILKRELNRGDQNTEIVGLNPDWGDLKQVAYNVAVKRPPP